MAYSTGKTSALQTAIKAGVDIALAEFQANGSVGDIMQRVHEVADELKVELFAQVDEDNKATASSGGGGGGGFGRTGGQGITVQDAKDMVLNFGAFKGMTLGDVVTMTADEATAYTNGKYTRAGLEWVKWCSSNRDPKGAFAAARAKALLDDFNRTTASLTKLAG